MSDTPEAYLNWLAAPKTIRTLALLLDSENVSLTKPFFEAQPLIEKLTAAGMQVSYPSFFSRISTKRLFKTNEAVLRIRYVQKRSTVGYRTVAATHKHSTGWISGETITPSSLGSQTSDFKNAVVAYLKFSLETPDGMLFEGGAENHTFPEELPPWLSATQVHHRAMQDGEDLLLGAVNLLSTSPNAAALKFLIKYGKHHELALARLSQLEISSELISAFLSKSPDDMLKQYWAFWPDGIRDPRPEVREGLLRLLTAPPGKDMLQCGTISLWGNYWLARLSNQNPSVASALKLLTSSENLVIALRACSILAANGESAAEDRLLHIAESSDWHLKAMAVWNIVKYGNDKLLRNAASFHDPGVRRLFWTSLSEFQALFDKVSEVGFPFEEAESAVYILLQGPACVLSNERRAFVTELAAHTLETDSSDAVRLAAVKALSVLYEFDIPVPDAVARLAVVQANDSNEGVRNELRSILGRFK